MPLIEHLLGDLEIQERRPKSWMEPRRKRLSFVRSRNPSHSRHSSSSSNPDEWLLAPARGTSAQPYYRNDAETWDLRRHEAQARFNDASIRHRDLEHRQRVHYIHQLYGPPPDLQLIHDRGHEQGMLEGGGIQTIRPRGHHADSDDEIIGIVDGSDDDDHDGHDDHHGPPHHQPLSIEHDRDRGRTLRDLTGGGGGKGKRGKSKGGKKGGKKGGGKKSRHDDDGSDSDDDDKRVFIEGVKAGIRASRSRGHSGGGHGGGGGSERGSPRTRRRFVRGDESEDSMEFRPRRRSRSRGRMGWGL